jgi:hypothetical protein
MELKSTKASCNSEHSFLGVVLSVNELDALLPSEVDVRIIFISSFFSVLSLSQDSLHN